MAAQKGHKKFGGRKAGTPNKRRSILEVCEQMGFDPFLAMAKIAADAAHERNFEALKELCQYIEPKKKSVDVALDPEKSTIRVVIEDYRSK